MDSDIKLILMDIHNALLTIQVILLSTDMSKELKTGLYEQYYLAESTAPRTKRIGVYKPRGGIS